MVFLFTFSHTRPSHKKGMDFKNTYKMSLNVFQFDMNFFKYMFLTVYFLANSFKSQESKDFKQLYKMSLKIFQFHMNFL